MAEALVAAGVPGGAAGFAPWWADREMLLNSGGPMSRTRTERVSSTVLGDRGPMLLVGLAVAVLSAVIVVILDDDGEDAGTEFVGESAQLLLPIALGDAVRTRRDRIAQLVETEADVHEVAELVFSKVSRRPVSSECT